MIQILQTPPPTDLTVPVQPSAAHPRGFVLLPPVAGRREAVAAFELPAQIEAGAGTVRLHQGDQPEKAGFLPQQLNAAFGTTWLHVGRGPIAGDVVGAPDFGFYSQVYLGEARTPVIELEQLSPLFRAGEAAEFTMLLDVSGR